MVPMSLHERAVGTLARAFAALRGRPSGAAALSDRIIRNRLRDLDGLDQAGQARRAYLGRLRLMFEVLDAIAGGSVRDPRRPAALLNAIDRNALLRGKADAAAARGRRRPGTALDVESIRGRLQDFVRMDRRGQVRRGHRGRLNLMLELVDAIAAGSVADPARCASVFLGSIDRDALLRGRTTPSGGKESYDRGGADAEARASEATSESRAEREDRGGRPARGRQPDVIMQRHARRIAVLLPEQRLIYFSTPKVASTTLKATLWRLGLGDPAFVPPQPMHNARHMSPLKLLPQLGFDDLVQWINQSGHRRFCFVRNPYTRLLSCYLHKIRGVDSSSQAGALDLRASLSATGSSDAISFGQFVEAVGRQSPMEMNPHWRVQTVHLLWDRVAYDFVGRIEEFEADLGRLGSLIGIDLGPYLHVRRKHETGAAAIAGEFYSPALQARVYDIYRADFSAFAYPFELPVPPGP